jgi:hypothetical protein
MSPRLGAMIIAACISLGVLGYFVFRHQSTEAPEGGSGPPCTQGAVGDSDVPVPTAQYLAARPAALQAGISSCAGSSAPSNIKFCDQVHRAQALVMAQKYRDAASRPLH